MAGSRPGSKPPDLLRGYAPTVLLLVVAILATYRLTRLIVADTFPPIARLRAAVSARWGDDSWQTYLSTCAWCSSMYVAAGLVAALDLTIGLPAPLLWVLALSASAGILDELIDPA